MSTRIGTSRGTRLLALSLATGTVVVAAGAAAASANAAPAAQKSTTTIDNLYSGTTDSSAIALTLNLPQQLNVLFSQLPSQVAVPNPVTLQLIHTLGTASHDGKAADTSTSTSQLIDGTLVTSSALSPVLGPLAMSVSANLNDNTTKNSQLVPVPGNPLMLSAGAGTLTASSSKSDRSNSSSGNLASLGLLSLNTIGVPAQLSDALNQVTDALNTAVSQTKPVTDALNTIPPISVPSIQNPLSGLTGALSGLPVLGPVLASLPTATPPITLAASDVGSTLQQLPDELKALTDKLLNGSLIEIGAGSTDQSIKPAGLGTVSSGSANIGDINLLGGLVTVTAGKATANANAAGVAGKSTSNASPTLANISVKPGGPLGDLLNVIADDKGIVAQLGVTTVDPSVQQALDTATSTLNDSLNTALSSLTSVLQSLGSGAQVLNQGTVTNTVSSDGQHAESKANPAAVNLGIPGAANLVQLSLGSVDVVANRTIKKTVTPDVQTTTTTTTTTTSGKTTITSKAPVVVPPAIKVPGQKITVPTAPKVPTKKLAFTGGDFPLTAGLAGLLLAAGAGLARRRRTAATD